MKKTWIAVLLVFSAACLAPAARWVKGNTHTHTNRSDGEEYLHRVARWYQDHGYHFLFITDHDMVTATAHLDADGNRDDFIVIPGEEISLTLGRLQAHVNSLNPKAPAAAKAGLTMTETLQNAIDAARLAGGIPHINHPFRRWSMSAADMIGLRNVHLFELLNMQRESNNSPAGNSSGTEGLWDELLTSGMVLYGVAADDTHDFYGEFLPHRAHPGKGWVVVRVGELTAAAVCSGLENGDFYASTGIELADVAVSEKEYRVTVYPHRETRYTTFFIGRAGQVLATVDGLQATYAFKGDELYVRAKVVSSMGETAF
nr:CehA/McbA family metallohydrolase [Acidobacteriota bacterium]